jgi:hypothetical protein
VPEPACIVPRMKQIFIVIDLHLGGTSVQISALLPCVVTFSGLSLSVYEWMVADHRK